MISNYVTAEALCTGATALLGSCYLIRYYYIQNRFFGPLNTPILKILKVVRILELFSPLCALWGTKKNILLFSERGKFSVRYDLCVHSF